jgi:hypothetical protein
LLLKPTKKKKRTKQEEDEDTGDEGTLGKKSLAKQKKKK